MPCDYNRYPPGWRAEIVPRILERARHRCEVCGLENKASVWSVLVESVGRIWVQTESDATRLASLANAPAKLVTVVLTVAHLDHDELNHDVQDDRLMAMCQWCHLRYDAPEKARRRAAAQMALPMEGDGDA